jgi:hypothetical protein
MAIIDKCPVLESLEISSRISGERVEELEARYARLKILSVLLLLAQMKSLAVICENGTQTMNYTRFHDNLGTAYECTFIKALFFLLVSF